MILLEPVNIKGLYAQDLIPTDNSWDFRNHAASPHKDTWCQPIYAADSIMESFYINAHRTRRTSNQRLIGVVNEFLGRMPVATVGNVIMVGLGPSGCIPVHVDDGAYAQHFKRYHIALHGACLFYDKGDDGVLYCNVPLPGDVFTFDHLKPHGVTNPYPTTRVHIIVDITLKE